MITTITILITNLVHLIRAVSLLIRWRIRFPLGAVLPVLLPVQRTLSRDWQTGDGRRRFQGMYMQIIKDRFIPAVCFNVVIQQRREFSITFSSLFLGAMQFIWTKTGLTSRVPIPWVNRNTAPSKSKTDLEIKYLFVLSRTHTHTHTHTHTTAPIWRSSFVLLVFFIFYSILYSSYRYYSSLPRELILRVFRRFRLDFELYDYSINDILIKAGYEPIDEGLGAELTGTDAWASW